MASTYSCFSTCVPPSFVSVQTSCQEDSDSEPLCAGERIGCFRAELGDDPCSKQSAGWFQAKLLSVVVAMGLSKRSVLRIMKFPAFLPKAHFRSSAESCMRRTSREGLLGDCRSR